MDKISLLTNRDPKGEFVVNYQYREQIKSDHRFAFDFMFKQMRSLRFDVDEPVMSSETMIMVVCLLRYFDELDAKAIRESPNYRDDDADESCTDAEDNEGSKPGRNERRLRIINGLAESRGSVLIFVPGMEHIKELQEMLQREMPDNKLNILPLHSDIVIDQQKLAFEPTMPLYRKVIISTTIAESSITVPDVKVAATVYEIMIPDLI